MVIVVANCGNLDENQKNRRLDSFYSAQKAYTIIESTGDQMADACEVQGMAVTWAQHEKYK